MLRHVDDNKHATTDQIIGNFQHFFVTVAFRKNHVLEIYLKYIHQF